MYIECANCGRSFTPEEVRNAVPPNPPHPLTKAGDDQLFSNQTAGGAHRPCPACGQKTLKLQPRR